MKAIKKTGLKKANITTRNFPESVQQLRKKLDIKDGGEKYLFFTKDKDENRIVIIHKSALKSKGQMTISFQNCHLSFNNCY